MHSRHKIIIIGAGPAGLATALHLLERAPSLVDDLVILEAREHPRPKLCGGAITFHGEEQLRRLGLRVDAQAFVADRLIFRLGARMFITDHHDAMRVFERAQFDAALAQAADARGLCIHSNERVLDLRDVEDGIEVVTNLSRYRAKVVVAADGTNSTVRRKRRFSSPVGVARLLRVMTPVDPAREPLWQQKAAVFDFSPVQEGLQGYRWDFPCYIGGEPYINRGIFDSRLLLSTERVSIKGIFARALHDQGIDLDSAPLEGHPVRWFHPNADFAQPHVLLTGDAAGVDPLFAEGISYAMEYGEVAAAAIEDAFSHGDFGFSTYRARLLAHPLGRSLRRRTFVAKHLYRYRLPRFWSIFWWLAGVSSARMKRFVGAGLDVLPN